MFDSSRWIPLSLPQRWMGDLVALSASSPLATVERKMRLATVLAARQAACPRPGWCAIFLKAYALLAARRTHLRRMYIPFPWPHLYEHPGNVASVAVARSFDDEDAVLFARLESPEKCGLWEIERQLRAWRERPISETPAFTRLVQLARLPRSLRRICWWAMRNLSGSVHAANLGTFGLSSLAGLGGFEVNLSALWTFTLHYGVIEPDGTTPVRLSYDPRVLDGVLIAGALADLEDVLKGEIINELGYLRDVEAA